MRRLVVVLLMSFVCLSGSNLYAFSGSGTSGDPYLISTAAELNSVGSNSAYWTSYFKLTTNINMSGYTGTSYNIIGNLTTKFTGGFDGNGYVISDLTYAGTSVSYVGLFGYTQSATIQNVQLTNVSISSSSGQCVGSLIGCQYYGTTTNCSTAGTVSASAGYYTGGLVGQNLNGTMNSCSSTATVSGGDSVGCLAGNVYYATISYCYATGNASGANKVGGLLGYSDTGTISNCYARGSATGTGGYIGGLVGYIQYGAVSYCYSTGAVSAGSGGWKGGLVGYSWQYSSPCVFTACFWDTQTSGTTDGLDNVDPDPSGVTGETTALMKTQSTFTGSGWDFTTVWFMPYNGYPHLQSESKYSGGSGTSTAPYLIYTKEDLYEMMGFPADWNKYFILMANLDLTGDSFGSALIAPDTNSASGGFQGTGFNGNFNGNGHVISNMTINMPTADFAGLFGYVYGSGQVINLGVEFVNIIGRQYVGGLTGASSNVSGCYATGTVSGSGDNYVGGLIGWNGGTISSCYATSSVSGGGYYVGGLAGYSNASGAVSNSYATGAVNGNYYVGGLIGDNQGSLSTSYAIGTADGDHYVGGLTGNNAGTVSSCYALGAAAGHVFFIFPSTYYHSYYVGGLMGYNAGTVTNCYAQGSATRQGYGGNLYDVGGLVGYNTSSITNCYSSGLVAGSINVGGLVGYNNGGSASNCFWDTETSGQASSALGTGKTTLQMKTESTFTGWDFSWVDGDSADWVLWIEGQSYPTLAWQPATFGGGGGTLADPWKIDKAQHLLYLCYNSAYYNGSYLMTADIDMSAYTGTMYKPIGTSTSKFTGTFDGGGHIISNLTYSTTSTVDYRGMFGYTSSATIRNLGLTDELIHSHGDAVGGLIGYQYRGHIYRCFTTGSVSGADSVGGMVGAELGSIDDSYSTASVTGNGTELGGGAGGLVGAIFGYSHYGVRTCYSAGPVSGVTNVGGLIGYSNSGLVENSFWDTETSNQATSAGGTAKNTEQMMNRTTFTAAGWDFLAETTNGTSDYWRLCTRGVSYPQMTWSFAAKGDFACANGTTLVDFPYLAQHWLLTGCTYSNDYCGWADIDVSGSVDTADLLIFAENWL